MSEPHDVQPSESIKPEKKTHEIEFALPTIRLVGAGVVAGLVAGGGGMGISVATGRPVLGAGLGGVALLLTAFCPLAISPWRPRTVDKWGAHLMAAQVISLMGVILAAVLLYFSTRPSELTLSAVIAAGFILAQILQISVFKSAIVDSERR